MPGCTQTPHSATSHPIETSRLSTPSQGPHCSLLKCTWVGPMCWLANRNHQFLSTMQRNIKTSTDGCGKRDKTTKVSDCFERLFYPWAKCISDLDKRIAFLSSCPQPLQQPKYHERRHNMNATANRNTEMISESHSCSKRP